MTAAKLTQLIVDFNATNGRLPTHVAITTEQYMALQAEKYMPGVRRITLDAWKKDGSMFNGIPLIWKEGVLC